MQTNLSELPLFSARAEAGEAARRRNAGMRQVLSTNPGWAQLARGYVERAVEAMPHGTLFIGEDLRVASLQYGLEPPHHPNAWGGVIGGVIRSLINDRCVEMAGLRRMSTASSHRRYSPEYRKIGM